MVRLTQSIKFCNIYMNSMLSKFAVKQKQHIRFIIVLFYVFNFFLVSRFFTIQIYAKTISRTLSKSSIEVRTKQKISEFVKFALYKYIKFYIFLKASCQLPANQNKDALNRGKGHKRAVCKLTVSQITIYRTDEDCRKREIFNIRKTKYNRNIFLNFLKNFNVQ